MQGLFPVILGHEGGGIVRTRYISIVYFNSKPVGRVRWRGRHQYQSGRFIFAFERLHFAHDKQGDHVIPLYTAGTPKRRVCQYIT